jgi:hypothetical protein
VNILHLGNLPLPQNHPDHDRLPRHPGRWVLNLAKAQKQHSTCNPEIVVTVPGANKDFFTTIESIPVHFLAAAPRFRSLTFFRCLFIGAKSAKTPSA